jgi:speckle-type POZ protein
MPSTVETLTDVIQSSKQIKIQGYSLTVSMADGEFFTSGKWRVGGYEWEVQVLPNTYVNNSRGVALYLYFRSAVPAGCSAVKATFSCGLIYPSGKLHPTIGFPLAAKFRSSGERCIAVCKTRSDLETSVYLKDDAFTVECTLKVLRELHNKARTHRPADYLAPCSGLHHHLGELLQKGTGSDVTLVVSGESITAHKSILASRSPVFMAEFFGHMKEKRSHRVEIKDMEAAVFRAMLHFIYTDSAPELDRLEDGMAMAEHLLVASDRYGIDRLKLICEDKLYDGINTDTAATTLVLAEQHGCSHLKAKCIELMAANLLAVMATEGYKDLTASCPSVMNDILKAVYRRKN